MVGINLRYAFSGIGRELRFNVPKIELQFLVCHTLVSYALCIVFFFCTVLKGNEVLRGLDFEGAVKEVSGPRFAEALWASSRLSASQPVVLAGTPDRKGIAFKMASRSSCPGKS